MNAKVIPFVLHCVHVCAVYVEIQRHFEFEDVLKQVQYPYWVWRSEASTLQTLRLEDVGDGTRRYLIEVKMCIEPVVGEETVQVTMDDIQYANDGPSDVIVVTLDGELWATYSTYEKWAHGHEWNIFRNTGKADEPKRLRKGEHIIGITVKTDRWGLELDKIRIIAEHQSVDTKLFCGGRLIDNSLLEWDDD